MATKKNFLIIGLGRFGLSLLEDLAKQKANILAIDSNIDAVERASHIIEHCLVCDATKENNLREIGVQNVDHAIVAIGGNIHSTLLTTIILKELGVNKITVRVDDEYYAQVMHKIGADEVVLPERIAAETLAHRMVSDSILDYYRVQGDYAVVQLKVGPNFKSTALTSLDSRNKFDVNIVGIIRNNKFFIPKGSDTVNSNDTLLVIGSETKVYRFEQYIND